MDNNKSGRGFMMRFYLLFLFFFSYPLFAQNSAGTPALSMGNEGAQEVPLNKVTAAFLQQQLQKETVLLKESIVDPSLFFPGIMRANLGMGKWIEPFSPGKMFHRCISLKMSIYCHWSFLRIDRLMGKEKNQNTQVVDDWVSAESFEEEVRRAMAFRKDNTTSVTWLLHFAIEFYDWAIAKEVSEPERLFPVTDKLAERFLNDKYTLFNSAESPILLYALYRYFLRRGFNERSTQIEDYMKKAFLHRSDGSEMDLQGKALTCNMAKRAGIHKDYLMENGLLFSDYEEFEERTVSEDIKRVQECEEKYETGLQLHQYDRESDIATHEGLLIYYGSVVFVLYKVFGKEAVRQFFRNNPLFYKIEIVPFQTQNVIIWNQLYWTRVKLALVLRDLYEDDVEWQVGWQSIIDGYNKELSDNLLAIYSEETLVSIFHILHFVKLSFLEQE